MDEIMYNELRLKGGAKIEDKEIFAYNGDYVADI
jgi:hypothetical protein